jgi:DNA-binding Lrp family transcriptional regulator
MSTARPRRSAGGLPDIIAVAEASDMKVLETMIVDRVQRIPDVDKTDTHIVASP